MRIDYAPIYRSTVGFDRLFNMLDGATRNDPQTYPPYNIEKTGDNAYRITMAVAGFAEADLAVEVKENVLSIQGRKADEERHEYLHQGIAARSFERRFQLADFVQVRGAKLENGLLHVELAREVPEEKKVRRIEIGGATPAKSIDANVANAA